MSSYWKKKQEELEQEKSSSMSYWDRKMAELEGEQDIAPVKKDEKKLDFFQKGAFEDGYQFGDVTKTVIGSFGDYNYNIVKGALGLVEGVGDLATYGLSRGASLIGKDETAEKLKTFAQRDMVDKLTPEPIKDFYEKNSVFSRTSDAILQGVGQVGATIATGGIGSAAGLGAAGVTALTTGTMGLSSMGSGMTEAYKGGATDDEAVTYGLIAGASDAITELIFGGLGKSIKAVGFSKGLSSADDMLAKKVSSLFTNQIAKNFAEYGIKAGAEGFEEVLAGIVQAAGKNATYMSEDDFWDILQDENLLEQFVVGAVTSGLAQGGDFIKANKSGRDFVSGMTQSEQSVIDRVVEDKVAERTKKGEKVSGKEKNNIYDSVVKDMERGYISTDTIEEVLGGDTYKSYKSASDTRTKREADLKAKIEELENLPKEAITVKQSELLKNLRADMDTLKADQTASQWKKKLDSEIAQKVRNTGLVESYNEQMRAGEDFVPDYSKYEGTKHPEAARKTIESVIKLGANNTNRVHDFVDMVAKTSADTGIVFKIQNNEQIKADFIERQTKAIAELEAVAEPNAAQTEKLKSLKDQLEKVKSGKVKVNGSITDDGIVLNLDSDKALNRLVGHEITHSLEKAKAYDALKKHLFAYAASKGINVQSEIANKKITYEGIADANPEAELVADLVGDFLFSDSEYVNRLSVENPNLFQKLFDGVKYLMKLATAGSKEARELEKVKRAFEKAYREGGTQKNTADSGVDHSIERTKSMSWSEQINGALYDGKNIRRNDTLVVGNLADTSVANDIDNKPLAVPLSVLTKSSSGKDISHSIKKGKLAKLDEGIKNAPITIVNPDRNAVVYVTSIKQGGLPIVVAFDMNANFDGDEVHKATSIHLQVDTRAMLESLPESATVYVQKNELDPVGATNNLRGLAAKIKFIEDTVAQNEADVKYSLVEDQETIDFLENQDFIVTYKAMALIDGKLYPPMASQTRVEEEYTDKRGNKKTKTVRKLKNPSVLGLWQQADERPDLAEKSYNPKTGYSSFDLLKSNGKTVPAAYNPYEHTSNIVLNDQFEEAYNRPELVTVEYHIPVSELTSGYKADYAKDSVGQHSWKSGPVAKDLKDPRQVYLTRWSKPVRILPDSEVAAKYKEILDGTGLSVPFNVVTPSLLSELEKAGVAINYDGSPMYQSIQRRAAEKATAGTALNDNVEVLPSGSVTKYSLSTWTPETQDTVRDNLLKAGFQKKDVDKWIEDTNSIAAVIASDKSRLDFEAADNQVMLKDNQEYIKTLDASTLCAKRLVYQGTFDAIQHRMPDTVLTSDMLIDLLNMMKAKGVQTPCGVCYVESRRRHLGKFAQQWLDGYEGEYKPRLDEVTTSDGLEALRKSYPDAYNDFVEAMNKKGSSNPKVVQLRTEYRNEILSLTPAQIRKIEAIGGLRVQSFSDFETPHMLDMMQAVMDMSAKGLHSQAYTKVPNFAWVFGDTGIKINLSLIAEGNGFDSNGNLAFSSTEGMDINEAMKLRDAYSQNVGTIIVGANDKHILACMADDRIDFIIPFHRSGWGMRELELMGMDSYTDYTYGQKEHDLNKPTKVVNGVQQYAGLENLYPPDYWNYEISGKENAERYLNLCAKLGREPKFSQFLVNNGDGTYSLQPDGSTDGYWKTLIDFKMYDNDGNGAEQQVVKPNFNMKEAHRVLNEYEGGANTLPVAKNVVDEFVAKYSNDIAPTQYSVSDSDGRQLSKEQQEFFKDSKVRDENGNLKVMYHGTANGGHTVFDTYGSNYGLFGAGSYFTDSKSVAEKYTDKFNKRGNANKQVYETYLNITNPMDMDAQANPSEWRMAFPEADFPESGTNEEFFRAMEEYFEDQWMEKWEAADEISDAIMFMGYDGITHIGGGRVNPNSEQHRVYIAFDPEQIKNLDNKKPTNDPDIRYSLSEDTEGTKLTDDQKRQFKGTKTVDENGNLKVLYHGSRSEAFTEFDLYEGVWLTTDPRYAEVYAGQWHSWRDDIAPVDEQRTDLNGLEPEIYSDPDYRMYKMYANIKNPADIGELDVWLSDDKVRQLARALGMRYTELKPVADDFMEEYTYMFTRSREFIELAKGKGFDGLKATEKGRETWCAIVSPDQVKLTTNQNPTDGGDIRYSLTEARELENAYQYNLDNDDMLGAEMVVERMANLAMPNSKIRGKDGNLIPVYHGTNGMFWEFDTSIDGGKNGTAEGYGIYTSDDPEVTQAYGDRQIKMYANITKPATSTKRTITASKLAALIKDTCKRQAQKMVADGEHDSAREALLDTWVSNYVYTYDIGMDRAYRETANSILQMNDNDMGIIQEVMAGMGIRDYAEATSFYRDSLTPITGFDGFVTQWENSSIGKKSNIILAFDSSQLKSADAVTYDDNGNVIPLSERFNAESNDIRNSISNSADDGFAPIGSFDIYGRDILKQSAPVLEDIAPVAETAAAAKVNVNTEPEEEVPPPHTDADAPPVRKIQTVKERLEVKLNNFRTELVRNERLREQSTADFDADIAKLQAEYDAKKNKNTKSANDILRRIERLTRMKGNVDADYAKRISDLESRASKVGEELRSGNSPSEQGAMRRELHASIVDGIKAKFAERGFDFDNVLKKAKNLSTFATVDNTPQRVMEKSLGYKEGGVLADITVNKVAQNETEGIRWLNSFTDRKNGLLAQISKQYNIKPGSKESAAAQMYAEGFYVNEQNEIIQYGDAELAVDFPDATKQAQIKGLAKDQRIRKIYDDTLAAINESRMRNAYPEIPRLDNYFLHFRAMNDTFSQMGLPFNPNDIKAKDLPTDLNGVTADLKPGQPFFASAMHREGKRTSFDLLGGLEQYLSGAKNQIYHIDDIQTLRALRNYIADTYGQANGLSDLDSLSEEEAQERIKEVYSAHLSTFAKFLNEEANVLAGKTALIDRGIEGVIGRRGMTFLDTLNRQVGANMVGYNVSSSLTNLLSPVQAFAKSNKAAFVKGMAQFASNKVQTIYGKGDGFAEQSPVMIRRRGAERFHRTVWQKLSDPGYILMSAVDNVSTELIARAKYNELVGKGMDSQQAHIETDKWVSRLMGDRSLGQQPQLYNSKMLGIITKFQLEVRNQLDSQFYDTIQEAKVSNEHIEDRLVRNAKTAAKVTSTLVQLAVAQHLFGKAFESVAGYNPAFDIISAIIKAFGWDDDEESEDTALDNIEQGFFELMEDMPYYSTFTGGRIPIESALPVAEFIKGKDKYGNDKSRWETLAEAAPYYFMPGGYSQIKKTVQGLGMFSDDHPIAGSYTDSGNLRFPVEDNLANRAQAAIFGQWASGNARDYFDNERSALKPNQIQEFVDVGMSIQDYWKYRDGLNDRSTLAEKVDYINGLNLTTAQNNVLVNNLTDRKEAIDMSDYDQYSGLEEFDYAHKNPEKYAFFEKLGIDYETYQNADDDAKDAYDWAFENPEKHTLSKAVASDVVEYRKYASDLYDIKADKDEDGKTISGSRKQKVLDYINSLDIDYGAKLILFKNEYNSDDESNYEIIEYLNGRSDISYEEEVTILRELGFVVAEDGTVYWD